MTNKSLRLTVGFRTILFITCYVYLINLEVVLPPTFVSDISSPFYLFVYTARFVVIPAILMPVFFTKQEIYQRLVYFRGLRLTHISTVLVFGSLFFALSSRETIPIATVYHLPAVIVEQFVYVVMASALAFGRHWLVFSVVILALFIYSHGLTIDLRVLLPTFLLLTTVYRTIIDQDLWWGSVYHFLWNFGIITITSEVNPDALANEELIAVFIWFSAMLLGAVLLVCQAQNMSQVALRMSSCLFSFAPLRQILSHFFYFSRSMLNHFSFSRNYQTARVLQNNILLYRQFRRFSRSTENRSIADQEKKTWPVPSAVIFWHSLYYFEDLFDLANKWEKQDIVLIVPRRTKSNYFENGLRSRFQTIGLKIEFVHTPQDLIRIKRENNSNQFCWIFGAEFLVRENEKSRMMIRQLEALKRRVFVHHPWQPKENSVWSLVDFDPDLEFLPIPSRDWLSKNGTIPLTDNTNH